MKKTIKFGIFGLGRGGSFYEGVLANNGEIVAVCDKDENKLSEAKQILGGTVCLYTDFELFINHEGLEAVMLANFFHEHAPYAIRALEKNIHVLSECTSNCTMAEGVALVRAAEKSKAHYMLAENYPYMTINQEMYRVYREGSLGKALYSEGEYCHPTNPYDKEDIRSLRPYRLHWRNYNPASYYITHSLAPLMYITGATPVRVTAMAAHMPYPKDSLMNVNLSTDDRVAIVTCLNDDDSVFRVTGCAHYGAEATSYRICGEYGQIENIRGTDDMIMLRYNDWNVPRGKEAVNYYQAKYEDPQQDLIERAGHGGSDFREIREFFSCIRENRRPLFDVYFATTMASVAVLSHRSLLENGVPYDIPDFRREEDRIKYENDTLTPFYGADGEDPTIPCASRQRTLSQEEIALYEKMFAEP